MDEDLPQTAGKCWIFAQSVVFCSRQITAAEVISL
jgi:hypothetical protein